MTVDLNAAITELPRTHFDELRDKLLSGRWVAAVYGLGYVGLQLATTIAARGIRTTGIDVSEERIAALRAGRSYIEDVRSSDLQRLTRDGLLRFAQDPDTAHDADVVIIAVPTPLDDLGRPDMSFVEAAVRSAAKGARAGQLISLESTTYPGTTREVVAPLLARSGLVLGRELFLVYSPERINPGDRTFDTATIPKLVGGLDEASADLGVLAYSAFVGSVHRVSSPEVAEMSKVFENIFRATNIALVNELAMLSADLHIDVWDVIAAASTKPFGFLPHQPGPGVGGHCIPIDPVYLQERARRAGSSHTTLMDRAIELNRGMPQYVVDRVARGLAQRGASLDGAHVLVLGIAYKADTHDTRESPAYKIIDLLRSRAVIVAYHDPHVPFLADLGMTSETLDDALLASMDAVVLVTDHASLDLSVVERSAKYIFDTRAAFRKNGIRGPHIETL